MTEIPLRERLQEIETLLRPTPVIPVPHAEVDLYAKLDYANTIGSIKDKPAFQILKAAILRGELTRDMTVVESSSGNFAIAIAVFCKLLGLRFIPVIDPNVSSWNEARLRTLCQEVVRVDERDDTGGFLKTRLRTVEELCKRHRPSFWPNQYGNPDAMRAHYEFTAAEICAAVPRLDYAFIGVSSGGTIAGASRRLKEHFPGVKIIAVDAEGSVIFGTKPRRRYLPGIGSSIVPDLLKHALIDDVVCVPERDTIAACLQLLSKSGLFVGASSGSGFAAVELYLPRMRGPNRPSAVFLCCDHGVAYLDTVFNPEWRTWHERQLQSASAEPAQVGARA